MEDHGYQRWTLSVLVNKIKRDMCVCVSFIIFFPFDEFDRVKNIFPLIRKSFTIN